MPDDLAKRLADQLLAVKGIAERPSMFGPGAAFWCNGKEIAHFDAANIVDLRLTKSVIRELRPRLRSDRRVTLRKGTSDWIEVRVSSPADVAFVLELAERAAAAHRVPTCPSRGSSH